VQRLRQAGFAGMYFLFPGVPRAVREKALKCVPLRCAALDEAIVSTAVMRDLVPDADEHLAWLQAQAPCDEAMAARLARSPAYPPQKLLDFYGSTSGVEHYVQALLDGGQ